MRLFKKKQFDNMPRRRDVRYSPVEEGRAPIYSSSFRRNRTLTGTTSSNVDSVGARSQLESPRTNVHHLSVKRRKVTRLLMIVILSMAVTWFLVSNLTAQVKIAVVDTQISKPVKTGRYERAIQDYLGANPASRISFFMDQGALTNYVASKLPEVEKVTPDGMASIGATKFVLTMRRPIAAWQIEQKQYYVDEIGIPFEYNYYSSPSVQIVDNSGVTVKSSGTAIASKRFLGFVGRVVSLARSRGYTVTKAILPPNTTRQFEATLEQGYKVKLTIDRPAGEQVEDMAAALQYFTRKNIKPEYIDVRVSGRAFYK